MPAARLTPVLRSGWWPAALLLAFAVAVVHATSRVPVDDLARFGAYVALWLTLPGTLAWRFVTRRRPGRFLLEDLAIGTAVGYLLEFPVYLACLALGVPWLYLGWPVAVLAVSLGTSTGRALWRRAPERLPLATAWATAAGIGYVVAWAGTHLLSVFPQLDASLRRSYVDEPFHLSLATGLRNHFPPEVPYVAGTSLDYHWLSHLHVAAASWASGLESVVLLRSLAVPTVFVVAVLATAAAAIRITGSTWVAPVSVLLVLVSPLNYSGWTDGLGDGLLDERLVLSPSAAFVNVSLMVGVLLVVEILRGRLDGRGPRLLLTLSFLAMMGAKSTALPTVLAGLVATFLVTSLLQRRLDRTTARLSGLALLMFVVGTFAFFGFGSHGLLVDPLALVRNQAAAFPVIGTPGEMALGVTLLAALSWLRYLAVGAALGALGLRRGWREPTVVFLVIMVLSGFGAGLVFHQSGLSEYYFVYVVMLPLALGATLGVHRLVELLPAAARPWLGATAAAGLLAALLLGAVTRATDPTDAGATAFRATLRVLVAPALVVLLVACAVAAAAVLLGRRRLGTTPLLRLAAPAALAVALAGMGLAPTARAVPDIVADPRADPVTWLARPQLIAPGGIGAARWLRAHSDAADLVATNVHCLTDAAPCQPRSFWISAYAERRTLVQGWAYVSWSSAGREVPEDQDTVNGPFWDPALLRENDAAFLAPSTATVGRLRARGVRWLFLDRAYPHDLEALERLASVRHVQGRYVVLELR